MMKNTTSKRKEWRSPLQVSSVCLPCSWLQMSSIRFNQPCVLLQAHVDVCRLDTTITLILLWPNEDQKMETEQNVLVCWHSDALKSFPIWMYVG